MAARAVIAKSNTFTITNVAGGGLSFTAQQGVVHVTGQNATINASRIVTAQQGVVHVTGQNASVTTSRSVTAQQGVVHVTGQNATVSTSRNVTAQQGVIHVTGQNADVTTGGDLSVTAQQGVIHVTGQNATIQTSRNVTAQQGVIHVTGQNASVSTGLSVTAQQGVIHVTGQNAAVTTSRVVAAQQGVIHVTGQNADVTAGVVTATGAGSSGGNYGRVYPSTTTKKKKKKAAKKVARKTETEALADFSEFLGNIKGISGSPTESAEGIESILRLFLPAPGETKPDLSGVIQGLVTLQLKTFESLEGLKAEILSEIGIERGLREQEVLAFDRLTAQVEAAQTASERARLIAELARIESEEDAQSQEQTAKVERLRALLLALSIS